MSQTSQIRHFAISNLKNGRDTVMLCVSTLVHIFVDASLIRRSTGGSSVSGGAVAVITQDGESTTVLFSVRFDSLHDINSGEAEIARVVMEWARMNYPETAINIYTDSQTFFERAESLVIYKRPTVCMCNTSQVTYNQCFRTRQGWSKWCRYCGGADGSHSPNGTTYEIQNMVQGFLNEAKNHLGEIHLYKVPAHSGIRGNDLADQLAKSGHHIYGAPLTLEFLSGNTLA